MAKKPEHFWIDATKLAAQGIDFCSLEAQGLWLKVMRLLHGSERYGHLTRDGKAVSDDQAARRCGIDVEKWIILRDELLEFELLKRSADGVLFSPELIAQAEWRAKNAKRQKTFQDNKRRQKKAQSNEKYNGQYNGYITPDITEESRVTLNSNTTISSNEENSGGKPPTAEVLPMLDVQGKGETDEAYFERKQQEFPKKPVLEIYRKFAGLCGSERYPLMRRTRRSFDKFLANEDDTLDIALEPEEFTVPGIGKLK